MSHSAIRFSIRYVPCSASNAWRRWDFLGLLVLAATFGASANAQQAAEESTAGESSPVRVVTVSASRLHDPSFEAPTPTRVLGAEEIEVRGAANVADLVIQMPGMTPSTTPAGTRLSRGSQGNTVMNLRGLGGGRNLVLINGRRAPAYNEFGDVNTNLVPSILVQRVEVVTGGASAAWGSDAISGVVNIIYDDSFEGAKLELQGGSSTESDYENYKLAFAFGSDFDDGAGHFLVGFEHYDNNGITALGPHRDWEKAYPGIIPNPANTSNSDGIPRFLNVNNVVNRLTAVGGVTVDQVAALNNLQFLPDGTARPRILGVGAAGRAPLMQGGEGSRYMDGVDLVVPFERQDLMVVVQRDLTDTLRFTFEGNMDRSKAVDPGATYGDEQNTIRINSGNPYLPASVQATMTANGIQSFQLSRSFEDAPLIGLKNSQEMLRFVAALDGELAGRWRWDASYQWARNRDLINNTNNYNRENLNKAADAVVHPTTGQIVCRSALSGEDTDCVPVNLFGEGNLDPAALKYFLGDNMDDTTFDQTVLGASISGDIVEGWAGPISAVIGVDYREEEVERIVDQVSLEADWRTGNSSPLKGDLQVFDVFAETVVPIISGEHELVFNGAVRWTDNTNAAGSVFTWKTGATFRPISPLLLRVTASKDVRSPTIGHTAVASRDSNVSVQNPFTGTLNNVRQFLSGNPFLIEESADNLTAGVVFSPGNLGLQISADWFTIDIEDAIQSIGAQRVTDFCFAGDQEFCRFITFRPDQSIERIQVGQVNLGILEVEGVDVAASYRTGLWGGALSFDLAGTHFIRKAFGVKGDLVLTDVTGELGGFNGLGAPDYAGNFTIDYARNGWGVNGRVRYISSGKNNNLWTIEDIAPEENTIPSVTYLDFSARYNVDLNNGTGVSIQAGVANALDKDPPVCAGTSTYPRQTNSTWYDVVGRQYFVSARLSF